jgi:membrane glycosyltransferase
VDPVAAAAVVSGLIGIVVFGLLLALVTGVLASWAGQRARADGRSMDNATIALGLAVLDGVVWLVLHFVFDLSFVAG